MSAHVKYFNMSNVNIYKKKLNKNSIFQQHKTMEKNL